MNTSAKSKANILLRAAPFFVLLVALLLPAPVALGGICPSSSDVVVPDDELARTIRDRLTYDPVMGIWNIRVSARNGIVYLFGPVPTAADARAVLRLVYNTPGVVGVANYLNNNASTPYQRDEDIKRLIERALVWTPYADTAGVRVSVEDGVATLTGRVLSWRGVAAAMDSAYGGGAVDVVEHLEVEHPAQPYSWGREQLPPELRGR
jgi:osmotically-inducible protein OsmY